MSPITQRAALCLQFKQPQNAVVVPILALWAISIMSHFCASGRFRWTVSTAQTMAQALLILNIFTTLYLITNNPYSK